MSIENAKALIKKAQEDKGLAERLRAAGKSGFAKIAQEVGLPCEVSHVASARKAANELSDSELGSVSGGTGSGAGNETVDDSGDDTTLGDDTATNYRVTEETMEGGSIDLE